MRFLADLHVHSHFSRATSKDLNLVSLHAWAQRKGISIVGTGDLVHPGWLQEIREQLEPAGDGLFKLKKDIAAKADLDVPRACRAGVKFMLQGEISNIYKHNGAVRKVHNVVFCPTLESAERFSGKLAKVGNVESDGRPILGISSKRLLEILLETDEDCHLVPAHIWTPWFSMLGSKSGYDSLEECFEDLSDYIFAVETGLSSDPAMNWRLSALDRLALISNSDAHSASKLGREANEFDLEPSYTALFECLRSPTRNGFLGTIEFYPEEGKYHYDGHRKCGTRMKPSETLKLGGICPVCGKKVTVGVMNRVEVLADRPEGARPQTAKPFERLIPLAEVLSEALCVGPCSKKVKTVYNRLLELIGPEFFVLRHAPVEEISKVAGPVAAEAVKRARTGNVHIASGFDGEFGKVYIFEARERDAIQGQIRLIKGFDSLDSGNKGKYDPKSAVKIAEAGKQKTQKDLESPIVPFSVRPSGPSEPPLEPISLEVSQVLASLNPEQSTAVTAPAGTLLVVAGPGTGKTRTLTHRIAYKIMASGYEPSSVLAVTFTNKAAHEMSQRLESLLGFEQGHMVCVRTFHALGLEILKAESTALGLRDDIHVLHEDECIRMAMEVFKVPKRKAAALLQDISRWKRSGATKADQSTRDVVEKYDSAMKAKGALDFDDLILLPSLILESDIAAKKRWVGRFRFMAVDEFQDMDESQYRLLNLLCPKEGDLTVIGDPNQSIYGFRGSDPHLFERLENDRPGAVRIVLKTNYRSTPAIISASGQILAGSDSQVPELVSFLSGGPRVKLKKAVTAKSEAGFVAREIERLVGGTSLLSLDSGKVDTSSEASVSFGDIAILYRLKLQARDLEQALASAGIPYRVVGDETPLVQGKGMDVIRALRELPGSMEAVKALEHVFSSMDGPFDKDLKRAWLDAADSHQDISSLLEMVCLHRPGDEFEERSEMVTLMTLHAAKGLEFPVVFVVGVEEGILPYSREGEGGEGDIESRMHEERRLLYVGMTRAKHTLYLTWASRRSLFGKTRRGEPSRFLADIEKALLEVSRAIAGGKTRKKKQETQLSLL